MAVMELWRRRDLEGTVKPEYIDGNFFTQDSVGNLVGVKCYKDGAEVALTGSVTGYCVLPSGETVSVAGTRSGNQASILVPQSALAYTGPLGITLKLIDGNTITTLMRIIVVVYQSKTDTVITPSSQIITDWANQISAALQEVEDASAAQDEKIDDLKSALNENDAATKSMQEWLGEGIIYKNSVSHGSAVSYNTTKTKVNAEAGWGVKVKIVDDANTSKSFVLYAKYEEDDSSTNIATVAQGAEYNFISAKTLEYIGIYQTGLADGTVTITATVTNLNGFEQKEPVIESDILALQRETGVEKTFAKTLSHSSSISEGNSRVQAYAEQGWDISVTVDDTNNDGFSYTLYVKYKEDESGTSLGNVGVEGVAYKFTSAKTLERISIYATSLSAGTITISVKVHNPNGAVERITDIESIINNGYVLVQPTVNASFSGNGPSTIFNAKRIRTELIAVKIGDEIYIRNGSLVHAVGAWNGEPSLSTNIRNDSQFITTDEKIISTVNGYYLIVFAKQNTTQEITPAEFDGAVELYNTKVGRDAEADNIPSYYYADDYITNKAARINELAQAGDDVFIFISDIHWERNARHSPDLIQYLSTKCNIPKLIDGGDVADGIIQSACDKYRNVFSRSIYRTVGNHDRFPPITGKNLYYAFDILNNEQVGNAFNHYYYVDNVQQKIRYVILNAFYHEGDEIGTGWSNYDTEQKSWFSQTALNLPANDWDVIVITHFLKTTSYLTGGADIGNAIDSFNAQSGHTGKVLAVFQGHTHWDGVYHTAGGVPVITITCDKWDLSNETSTIPAEGIAWREKNTIKEQAFDVVILNREARKFTCVRIGAPAQNNIDKYRTDSGFTWIGTLEEREISY